MFLDVRKVVDIRKDVDVCRGRKTKLYIVKVLVNFFSKAFYARAISIELAMLT